MAEAIVEYGRVIRSGKPAGLWHILGREGRPLCRASGEVARQLPIPQIPPPYQDRCWACVEAAERLAAK